VSGTEYLLGLVIKPESLADASCGTDDSAIAKIKAPVAFRIVIEPSYVGFEVGCLAATASVLN